MLTGVRRKTLLSWCCGWSAVMTTFFLSSSSLPLRVAAAQEEDAEETSWLMPIYMSTVAGASTCIGAAIVFCQPQETVLDNDDKNGGVRKRKRRRSVSPATMAFCLALAGSVMMTVTLISIGPECLTTGDEKNREWIPLFSWMLVQRLLSLGLGCLLYMALSYFAFPEVDEVLGMAPTTTEGGNQQNHHYSPLAMEEGHTKTGGDENNDETSVRTTSSESTSAGGATTACRRRTSPSSTPSTASVSTTGGQGPPNPVGLFHWTSGKDLETREQRKAWRVTMLLFASLLFHNFPEGLAVAASALESRQLGIAVTIGIMIHNIPEGIAIAVPCLAARPQHAWMAFGLASLSGLAEPLGATVALFCFSSLGGGLENILAFVAGIMMSVALFDLFPEALKQKTVSMRPVLGGTVLGIVIMVVTELSLPA